jgi:mRNA interferase RelE/StbE
VKFNLVYAQRAIRDVRNMEASVRLRVSKTLLRFREDPLKYAEKIADAKLGSYRFRIGDYRVIFDLEGEDIVILRVGHRRDIYRR